MRMTTLWLIAVLLSSPLAIATENDELWIRIDTAEKILSVMQGRQVLQSYDSLSLGRGGTTRDKMQGDEKTPLGEYHVSRISYDSRFYLFIGLDYPSYEQAERAFKAGIIGKKQYSMIRYSLSHKQEPPQQTALGGYIGIHGVGNGDKQIHETINWTNGCVALTNAQVDDLETWIYIGMRVVIR